MIIADKARDSYRKMYLLEKDVESNYKDIKGMIGQIGAVTDLVASIVHMSERIENIQKDIEVIEEMLSVELEKTVEAQIVNWKKDQTEKMLNETK